MQLQNGGGEHEKGSNSATLWSLEDSQCRQKGVSNSIIDSEPDSMDSCGASVTI